MADRVALLNAYADAAAAALAVGDPATALNNARAAQAIQATLPKLQRSSGTGGGSQLAEWDQTGIDNLVKRCQQAYGATLGVQVQSVEFVRPESLDDGAWYTPAGEQTQ